MKKTEKVMENHGIFCNLKGTNPVSGGYCNPGFVKLVPA